MTSRTLTRPGSPSRFPLGFAALLAALFSLASVAAPGEFGAAVHPEEVGAGSLLLEGGDGRTGLLPAPTVDTAVSMSIAGLVARVTVEQSFTNPGSEWANGIYVFPLPEDAAVDRLHMTIGERVIEGRIAERETARRTYEQARADGRKASLVEQQRPNLFTNRVANIGPGETVRVRIAYQQTVAYDKGRFSLRFPMTTGIRYIPGKAVPGGYDAGGWAFNTDEVPDASAITPPVTPDGVGHANPVTFDITLDAGFPLAALDSTYHPISVAPRGAHRHAITLANGPVSANRDFELTWTPEPRHAPRAALFTQQREGAHYGLLMIVPPEAQWAEKSTLPREMIYVIDTSGSMHGTSIVQAREALELGLAELRAGDTFNVLEFNSATRPFMPKAVAATPENLALAKRWVRGLRANGGTEMAKALRSVLVGSDDPSRVRQVVFLTDGSVGNENALFEIIHRRLGDTRLFTVGIGSAPNSHFMREAAAAGRGTFTYIGDVGEVREKMTALFEKLAWPVLSDLVLTVPDGGEIDYWPNPLRDLYVHEPLVVSFRTPAPVTGLTVFGRMQGAAWSADLPVGGANAAGLDVLWARSRIQSLEQQRARGMPAGEIRAAITELGLAHHIVTAHTSLVAVDVTPTRPADADTTDRAVPAKKPHGWEMQTPGARLPQTATPAALHALLGLLGALGALLLGGRRAAVR